MSFSSSCCLHFSLEPCTSTPCKRKSIRNWTVNAAPTVLLNTRRSLVGAYRSKSQHKLKYMKNKTELFHFVQLENDYTAAGRNSSGSHEACPRFSWRPRVPGVSGLQTGKTARNGFLYPVDVGSRFKLCHPERPDTRRPLNITDNKTKSFWEVPIKTKWDRSLALLSPLCRLTFAQTDHQRRNTYVHQFLRHIQTIFWSGDISVEQKDLVRLKTQWSWKISNHKYHQDTRWPARFTCANVSC